MALEQFASSHIRKHTLIGTDDHEAGNHKLFYSNGSGQLVELSLAEVGHILMAMGSSQAPLFMPFALDNGFVNGDFNLWQEGTSFPSVYGAEIYTADGFAIAEATTGAIVGSRSTDVPILAQSGHQSIYSLNISPSTAVASYSASHYALIVSKIEGYIYRYFAGHECTLGFWIKSPKTGAHCVSFRNTSADRSYIAQVTVNAVNTWEYKEVTLTFNDSIGSYNYTNGAGLMITWAMGAGSIFHTAAGAWTAGNYLSTSSQVNCLDNTGNNFRISQVRLSRGSKGLPYTAINPALEIMLNQRYFFKSYPQEAAPGTITDEGCIQKRTQGTSGAQRNITSTFPQIMRTSPTVVWYSPASGNSGNIYNASTQLDVTATGNINGSDRTTGYPQLGTLPDDLAVVRAHFTANARL